jgi:hypothetical protein
VKIHGYSDEGLEVQDIVSSELAEITLVATSEELRRIARFLDSCADGIDARGKSWEHEHLSDRDRKFQGSPHFVVANQDWANDL